MTFNFERPNKLPTLLQVDHADNFTQDLQKINTYPPQYDKRTLDDVQLTDGIDKLDKMDAIYVAEKMYNENANKYAQSETHKKFSAAAAAAKTR